MTKYIFVTGGVVSSIGKGIIASSIGRLLKSRNLSVSILKFDPYINIDAGTMSPYQHGEVFVTNDGAETDLDLGHYERFVDIELTKKNNITTGSIYQNVINKERKGDYLSGTVQVIPHITDEIKSTILDVSQDGFDIVIIEIGGTIGDIESLPFIEAIRQFKKDVGRENTLYIHVTLIPSLSTSGEQKTKPTQHSVKELRSYGIQPDILICRSDKEIPISIKEKLSLFCDIDKEAIIECKDVNSIYDVPIILEESGLSIEIIKRLKLDCSEPELNSWIEISSNLKKIFNYKINIAIVGKYVELPDAYMSVIEAIKHAGAYVKVNIDLKLINSEEINENNIHELLKNIDGIIVPGGFGERGIEGKILSIKYARENNIPFLGLCLGLQLAVIEFARNVCNLKDANSTEFDSNTKYPIIDLMEYQKNIINRGGTMRLGNWPCKILKDSKVYQFYKQEEFQERHRHRYEVNNAYRDILSEYGLKFSGTSPDHNLVEIIEIPKLDYFVACQFHPEFKSRPNKPHPLFIGLVYTSLHKKEK
jgi:CTP synthase